jgi:hypothetical protein
MNVPKAFVFLNNDDLYLRNCTLINFRIGIEIQDLADSSVNRSAKIIDVVVKKCSTGASLTSQNTVFKVCLNKVFILVK